MNGEGHAVEIESGSMWLESSDEVEGGKARGSWRTGSCYSWTLANNLYFGF
jgi:hypothetical protein